MTTPSQPSGAGYSMDGIEVVELSEVDLEFAIEDAFKEGSQTLESTTTEPARPEELAGVELFNGLGEQELAALAPRCQSIHAVPGYVLLAPGRLNSRIFFVSQGQLRLYTQTGDKRPLAIADVGHSTGLRSALAMQPADHAVIATEISHVLAVDVAILDDCIKRLHVFARNYAALLASYLRGDNCLYVGARSPGSAKRLGYIDELTLLHNQHWLDTIFPRLVARYRMGSKSLAVTAFAVDKLEQIVKEHGIGAGLRLLETVGHWMLDHTRPNDILAIDKNRHILAFLPECDLGAARKLADRLKTLIQKLPIVLTADKAAAPITITLSVGIATLEPGMKENDFLSRTEALIQKSLKLGGNWLSETL